jgi:hypothetical protein
MKQLFLILCLSTLFNSILSGQEKSDINIPQDILDCLVGMGKDTISTLNVCESKFLNFCFQKEKGAFDFSGKKIAFFRGNAGTLNCTKEEYFAVIELWARQGFLPSWHGQLIIFTKDDVKKTGYDAVIVSPSSKKYLTIKEVVKRLKK